MSLLLTISSSGIPLCLIKGACNPPFFLVSDNRARSTGNQNIKREVNRGVLVRLYLSSALYIYIATYIIRKNITSICENKFEKVNGQLKVNFANGMFCFCNSNRCVTTGN